MRGKPQGGEHQAAGGGNIPAYAGKTHLRNDRAQGTGEHPRVCGENIDIVDGQKARRGTSPRMRGKLGGDGGWHDFFRNIPAYAGKTEELSATVPAEAGTSPRMRGKLTQITHRGCRVGNIPAYAGKTAFPA